MKGQRGMAKTLVDKFTIELTLLSSLRSGDALKYVYLAKVLVNRNRMVKVGRL